ncbi:amidohydrolase [Streptomyces asiaticus]|uniref:amidohydrolase family protein n=1 Tax=Streptomyces asiaticus TaxID=114695 RepID=UPI0039BDF1A4
MEINPGVLGLRITTAWPPRNVERLRAGAYDRLLSTAEKHGVPVCVLGAGDLPDVAVVARAYPTLPLIIDHLGLNQPPFMPADDPPWRDLGQLLALADLPNVSVKLSGAPTLSDTPYPYPDIWPHLRQILDAFGVDRCMWGTDQHRIFGRLHGFDPVRGIPATTHTPRDCTTCSTATSSPKRRRPRCSAAPFARSWAGRRYRHRHWPRAPPADGAAGHQSAARDLGLREDEP